MKRGAHVQAYGAVLSTSPDLPLRVDRLVVGDWNQCKKSEYGQFAGLIQDGSLRDEHVCADIGKIVAGLKPGRESDDERNLFWHKGFAISDIVISHLAYERAVARGMGTWLPYYADPKDM